MDIPTLASRLVVAAACGSMCAAAHGAAPAGRLVVTVVDRDSKPVADVAVYAVPAGQPMPLPTPPPSAVMDQRNKEFVPHVLVVQAGTSVDFPNNDTVSHHVYSFSKAHPFELALYKGDPHPPLTFDTAGLVVLGCNIHDSMLGYILVVDTPYFGKTRADGRVDLGELPPGQYAVHVWTDRLKEDALPAPVPVELPAAAPDGLTVRFSDKLYPPYGQGDSSLRWNDY
ncbi:MAG TPA: methylamine utilization protein [Gammaproteobacteria bacterium]|nr:methylamine utilization protein [Gammaproteobacteria bacterium]